MSNNDSKASSNQNASRKSSKESLYSTSESAHDIIERVLNIIKLYLFSHITLGDIVDTFKSLHYNIDTDTVKQVIINHLTSYLDIS